MNALERVYQGISEQKVPFFAVFFVVVMITYAILYAFDFYPEPKAEVPEEAIEVIETNQSESNADDIAPTAEVIEAVKAPRYPVRIVIPKSETDTVVLNPDSLDMNDLDTALLDGVVRHPQSAHFAETGNILIFGHSSYLPTVFNKNFQAFNGVQNLNWGDEITVYDEHGGEFVYRVNRVYKVKASETIIDNGREKAMLTLVTCNSFGSKDDRFIVEALLVENTRV